MRSAYSVPRSGRPESGSWLPGFASTIAIDERRRREQLTHVTTPISYCAKYFADDTTCGLQVWRLDDGTSAGTDAATLNRLEGSDDPAIVHLWANTAAAEIARVHAKGEAFKVVRIERVAGPTDLVF
jgi:hypothetical protein